MHEVTGRRRRLWRMMMLRQMRQMLLPAAAQRNETWWRLTAGQVTQTRMHRMHVLLQLLVGLAAVGLGQVFV